MLAWLTGLIVYPACVLLTARVVFGAQRSRIITEKEQCRTVEDPVERFEAHDRAGAAIVAFMVGLVWPVTVPGYGLYRLAAFVIMANPPRTEWEREYRLRRRGKRIHELERTLGLVREGSTRRP